MPLLRRSLGYLTLTALSAAAVAVPASAASAITTSAKAHSVTNLTTGGYLAGDYVADPHPVTVATVASMAVKSLFLRSAILPASVDLRANVPAVENQGNVGDCTAWAIGYYSLGYLANVDKVSGAPYAPLYLYMRSLRAGNTAPNGGTSGWDTLTEAQTNGIDTQANYIQGTTNYQVPPTAAEIANAAQYKVTGWSHLFEGAGQGANAQALIEQSLAAGDPVDLALEVYANFEALGPNQVYTASAGADMGGHMLTGVGYNATGVIVRNSWGPGWGTNGDATIAWSYINQYIEDAYAVSGISGPPSSPAAPVQPPTPTPIPPASQPAATTLSAVTGPSTGGTAVAISGLTVTGATAVAFGVTPATFTAITNPTSGAITLVAISPAHLAGLVEVTVTTPAGTTGVGRFTYRVPVPVVSTVAPTSTATTGGAVITVTGSGFTGVRVVHLGAVSVRAVAWSDTVLKFIAPRHAAGVIAVQAVSTAGPSQLSVTDRLTYVAPAKAVRASKKPVKKAVVSSRSRKSGR